MRTFSKPVWGGSPGLHLPPRLAHVVLRSAGLSGGRPGSRRPKLSDFLRAIWPGANEPESLERKSSMSLSATQMRTRRTDNRPSCQTETPYSQPAESAEPHPTVGCLPSGSPMRKRTTSDFADESVHPQVLRRRDFSDGASTDLWPALERVGRR